MHIVASIKPTCRVFRAASMSVTDVSVDAVAWARGRAEVVEDAEAMFTWNCGVEMV